MIISAIPIHLILFIYTLILTGTHSVVSREPDSIFIDSFFIDTLEKLVEQNPDSALTVLNILEKEALRFNDEELLSEIYTLHARADYLTGNYTSGIDYGKRAAELHSRLNHSRAYYQSLIQLGALNFHQGNWLLAKEYLMTALRYFEETSDTLNLLRIYVNLSGTHIMLNNLDISHQYVERATDLSNAIGSEFALAKTLNNAGIILFMQDKNDKAKDTFLQALEMAVRADESQSYLDCLNHLGLIEMEEGNFLRALDYYKQMMEFSGVYIDRYVLSEGMINKGKVYDALENLPGAVEWTEKSIEISTLSGDHSHLKDAYRQMALYLKKMNRIDEAFVYMEKYSIINDSLLTTEKNRSILEMEAIYESEKREKQISHLEFQNIINEEKIKTITRNSVLAVALILVSGLFVLLLLRHKQRKIQLVNLELEHQLLRTQMNPHFVFNSLTAIQNYILKSDSMVAATFLAKFTRLMRLILQNSSKKFISLDHELETINNYLELQSLRFPDRFSFILNVSPDLNPEEIQIPPMLAQPFIENAIKHSFKPTGSNNIITISYLQLSENKLQIVVEDNGIGRLSSRQTPDKAHQSFATEITRNRIMSLKRMGYRESEFRIEDKSDSSGKSAGTKVIFFLPLTFK